MASSNGCKTGFDSSLDELCAMSTRYPSSGMYFSNAWKKSDESNPKELVDHTYIDKGRFATSALASQDDDNAALVLLHHVLQTLEFLPKM